MINFAVGIPTLNEADNIGGLTQQIDQAANELGIRIHIINSDNNSNDGTAEKFKSTETINPKVSLTTEKKGKGRNVLAIFEFISKNEDIEYCFLIDGDITSFNKDWLKKQYEKYLLEIDYVLPHYKRRFIEGNATNHFCYPIMRYLLNGDAPRQPIAGDIGLSRGLILYILKQEKNNDTYGYGIDIFISIHALYFNGKIAEISLDQKLHKPSFPKMVQIFKEEASNYYLVRKEHKDVKASFVGPADDDSFLTSPAINNADLSKRLNEAKILLENSRDLVGDAEMYLQSEFINSLQWANVIAKHELLISDYSPEELSQSLTPYYLLRAVSYLKEATSATQAEKIINEQADFIKSAIENKVKI